MKKLSEIIEELEIFAPPSLAQFDYVGLLQGDMDQSVKKIGLTLDYSLQAIEQAIKFQCQLLITHHGPTSIHYPLFGNNLHKISLAQQHKLGVYRCHLNLDFCKGGIIEELSNILEIPTVPSVTRYESYIIEGGVRLSENYPLTFIELMKRIEILNSTCIRIAGPKKKHFNRIALTSGKGFISEFFDQIKPDVYIAGEFEQEATKYAEDLDIMLVELSHHASEARPLINISPKLSDLLNMEVVDIEIPDTLKIVG